MFAKKKKTFVGINFLNLNFQDLHYIYDSTFVLRYNKNVMTLNTLHVFILKPTTAF